MDPAIAKSETYKIAEKEANEWVPDEGVDYHWAYDYVRTMLADARSSTLNLEKKAQHVIAFVAPGSGLFTLALALLRSYGVSLHWTVLVTSALAILSLGFSVLFAFFTLVPMAWTLGPDAMNATRMAEKYPGDDNKALGGQAAAIASSVTYMCLLMNKKGKRLKLSYVALLFAVLCFVASAALSYFFRI